MKYVFLFFLSLSLHAADKNAALYFSGNCITCHHITKTISAPSITEVKKRYLSAFSKKEDFVHYMSVWVYKPNEETSLMHDAIAKHELMPELAYDIDTLKIIAEYIYETDFKTFKTHLQP